MSVNKNSKGFVWLIIILIILVFGIVGFVVYDNFFKINKTISKNNDLSTTSTTIKISKNEIEEFPENDVYIEKTTLDFIDGCKDNKVEDCYSVDNYKNYNQENISENIRIKCDNYAYETDERSNKFCYISTMIIDDKINHTYENQWNFGLSTIEILKTSKYIILQEKGIIAGNGKIVVYDYNGNKLKELNNTVTSATITDDNFDNNFKENMFNIKIKDNNLYYAYKEKDNHNCDESNYLHIGYVDLENDFKYTEMYKVKAITNHEC